MRVAAVEVPPRRSRTGKRPVALLVLGQGTSTLGDGCYAVALPWYVLASRGSTSVLGATLTAFGVARALAMPLGGMMSDRLGPKRVLLGADALRCLLLAGMTALATSGPPRPLILVPLATAIGACNGLFTPGSYALVPTLVTNRLQEANAALNGATQIGALLGPVLGAALVARIGPASVFGVDAATFAVSAFSLGLMRQAVATGPPSRANTPTVRTLFADFPALPTMLTVVLAGNVASAGVFAVALPALAHAHWGAGGFGFLLAGLAIGAVGGTALGAAIRTRRPAVFASTAFLAQAVALAVLPYVGGLRGAVAASVVFGLTNSVGELIIVTAVQRSFPPDTLGRVMGLIMVASAGAFPISVTLTTSVVRHAGTAAAFPLAGVLSGCTILCGLSRTCYRNFGVLPRGEH